MTRTRLPRWVLVLLVIELIALGLVSSRGGGTVSAQSFARAVYVGLWQLATPDIPPPDRFLPPGEK